MDAEDGGPSTAEIACFEAGIKLGALYHQFTGTPLTEDAVESLEAAVEDAVASQRYVSEVEVGIEDVESNRYGYAELEGGMLDVHLEVEVDGVTVQAHLVEEEGYPQMKVDSVEDS